MEQDPYIGRYFVGRRYLREHRLYHVVGTYMPAGYNAHYRCDSLEYSGDNLVSMAHHLIDIKEAGDIFVQEITEEQYQLGIDLFYKSLMQIRQFVASLKGTPCDQIHVGKAYRLFEQLYFNVQQNPQDGHTESRFLEINPLSVSIRITWIPSSLIETNRIDYEEIDATDVQKAIKQFEFLYATVRSYIDALAKKDNPVPLT